MKLLSKIILIFLFVFSFISASPKKIKAPDFELFDLNKNIIRLSDKKFDNHIIILNFWATWCPPCRMEIPGFVKFYKEYQNKKVVLLGICLDVDDVLRIKKFVKEYKINYPILIGTRKVVGDYGGIPAIPTTFILNHERNIVDRYIGAISDEDLKLIIDKLIELRDSKNSEKVKE